MKIILIIACAISFNSYSQLETVHTSVNWMVSTEFLGPNYAVTNIEFNGTYAAHGQFDATNTTIGLNKGIILTTGTVLDIQNAGPHGPNNNASAGLDNSVPGHTLLSNLINGTATYDASVLEFDFVPSVDSISFNYVFGSEEYPEYAGATYNDVFAIFISGPGIPGIENIAVLPNGAGVVSIGNVNNGSNNNGPCQNCAYYVHNGDGNDAPYNSSDTYVQYDGHTVVLTARKSGLLAGEAYHLIIAIADAGDGIVDSGLFLESCETCNYNVGINEPSVEMLKIYPNPARELLHIEKEGNESGELHIHDLNGSLIMNESITRAKSKIDISNLPSGMYMVTVQAGGTMLRSKLVVE
ncbi:MAG: T9SS type A sorting domain-containing protein [Lentisphaeria bacterium]|nr:T9SS type A sorting domain-containing protein [Lentisphaeria bacterium]